jgi:hypothetical protein
MARDWKRLTSPSNQSWYHHLRINGPVFGGKVVALFEVQEAVLPRDALQVQRDANAEARLRAVICVEFHLSHFRFR